jgi:hypothetical protein
MMVDNKYFIKENKKKTIKNEYEILNFEKIYNSNYFPSNLFLLPRKMKTPRSLDNNQKTDFNF